MEIVVPQDHIDCLKGIKLAQSTHPGLNVAGLAATDCLLPADPTMYKAQQYGLVWFFTTCSRWYLTSYAMAIKAHLDKPQKQN